MKYSFYPETEIKSIPVSAEKIHFVRPIKEKKVKELIKKRKIKEISLSESTLKRMKPKTIEEIEKKGIQIKRDSRKGRAIEMSFATILKIIELKKDYLSTRKIEKETGIPKSTVHYLLKYANRNKIKKKNQTIYLE
jgi:biotin operon repressor